MAGQARSTILLLWITLIIAEDLIFYNVYKKEYDEKYYEYLLSGAIIGRLVDLYNF